VWGVWVKTFNLEARAKISASTHGGSRDKTNMTGNAPPQSRTIFTSLCPSFFWPLKWSKSRCIGMVQTVSFSESWFIWRSRALKYRISAGCLFVGIPILGCPQSNVGCYFPVLLRIPMVCLCLCAAGWQSHVEQTSPNLHAWTQLSTWRCVCLPVSVHACGGDRLCVETGCMRIERV